jgi:hypothetical protein
MKLKIIVHTEPFNSERKPSVLASLIPYYDIEKHLCCESNVDPSHEEVIAQCQFYGEVTKRIRAMVEELYKEKYNHINN